MPGTAQVIKAQLIIHNKEDIHSDGSGHLVQGMFDFSPHSERDYCLIRRNRLAGGSPGEPTMPHILDPYDREY